jgi:hypothetical protein
VNIDNLPIAQALHPNALGAALDALLAALQSPLDVLQTNALPSMAYPIPPVLKIIKPILRIATASPPTIPRLFRPIRGGVAAERKELRLWRLAAWSLSLISRTFGGFTYS